MFNRKIISILSLSLLLAGCFDSKTETSAIDPATGQPVVTDASGAAGATLNGTVASNDAAAAQFMAQNVKPYRTWIRLEGFVMENNGEPENPISNVRLETTFPNGQKLELPGNGQFWTIGNGQMQEIKQTFEIPWSVVQNDGFNFTIKMVRKGSDLLPCKFEVRQLSQFNRKYVCHTDIAWQQNMKIPENKIEKEGIEVKVFTDRNTPEKDIPKDAIAFK